MPNWELTKNILTQEENSVDIKIGFLAQCLKVQPSTQSCPNRMWSRSVGSRDPTPNCWLPEGFCYGLPVFPGLEGGAPPEHTLCTPLCCTTACTSHSMEWSGIRHELGAQDSTVHLCPSPVPCVTERRYSKCLLT